MIKKNTLSSENPLLVFISSVMNYELQEARDIVKDTLESYSFFKSWLFEYTPASPTAVDKTYLQKVKDADYVIWLIGSHTTDPVANEIKKCLENYKDNLFVFKLPSYQSSELTKEILDLIGTKVKWKEVDSLAVLKEEINLAIGDDIIKAIRNKNSFSEIGYDEILNEKIKLTKEEIIRKWDIYGLSYEKAEIFYNDSTVGVVREEYLPNAEKPVSILLGDFGSGKTLIALRYFYQELLNLIENKKHPVPLFFKANYFSMLNLKNAVDIEKSKYKEFKHYGTTIIIDGLNEISGKTAKSLLEECYSISRVDKTVKILITARNLPTLFNKKDTVNIELLSNREIGNIFDIISGTNYQVKQFGTTMNFDRNWSFSIKEAIKRPLFAILLANYIEQNKDYYKVSIIEIIEKLIRQLLIKDDFDTEIENLLIELAVKLIEKPNKRINENDLNLSHTELLAIQRSHFIHYENKYLSFKLSLFLEWFACQKLLKDDNFINQVIMNSADLENWRFIFALLITTTSFEKATILLKPIIEKYPSFAGSLISESLDKTTLTDSYHYTEEIVNKQIEYTFQEWIKVLNTELSSIIAPVKENGELRQYEIKIEDKQFKLIWFRDDRLVLNDKNEMLNRHILSLKPESIISVSMNKISNKPDAWIWFFSFDYLRDKLEKSLKEELFYMDDGILYEEKIWTSAIALSKLRNSQEPVPLSLIEARYPQGMFGRLSTTIFNKRRKIDLTWFRDKIQIIKNNKFIEISDPHPLPVQIQEEIERPKEYFKNFSSDELFNRITHIFQTAIIGYKQLVEKYFTCFRDNLRLYAMLPINIRGSIIKDSKISLDKSIQVKYYFDVLPEGMNSKVEFEFDDYNQSLSEIDKTNKIFPELRDNILKLRGDKLHIIQSSSYFTDSINPRITDPSTRLIYRWLWNDLERISWVQGSYSDWRNK